MPEILRTPRRVVEQARKDRAKLELPEILLWQQLRKRPGGFNFRRQNRQLGYRIDFACLAARLAIEVDGEAHARGDRAERDARRDHRLEQRGFPTLRIPASDILHDLDAVLVQIVRTCRTRLPLHHWPSAGGPPPRSGEDFQG